MRPRLTTLRRRGRDQNGQVLPIVALCMVFVIIGAAFGIDLGMLTAQKRKLQSVADLVALDVLRSINGTACNAIQSNGQTLVSNLNTAAVTSAQRNNFTVGGTNGLTVEPGIWNAAAGSFSTFGPSCASNVNGQPNAVRITAAGQTQYGFARVIGLASQNQNRSGIASRIGTVDFSLGSSLIDVNSSNSPLLNPLMNALLGTGNRVSASLVSYQGLANSTISLAALATQMGLGLGSSSNLMNTSVSMSSLLSAASTVLANNGNSTAAATLANLAAASVAANSTLTTRIGDLVKLASGTGSTADAQLNVFQLITGSAQIANGSNFVNIPGLTLSTGLAGLTVQVQAIQPQQMCIGFTLTTAPPCSTQQVTVKVTPTISPLNILGLSQLVSVQGSIPITITAGGATASPTAINCDGSPGGFTLGVSPQAGNISTSFSLTSSVAGVLGTSLTTTGTGVQTVSPTYSDPFTAPFPPGTPASTHNGNTTVGLNALTYGQTTVSASLLGLGLTTVQVYGANLATALSPILTPLDTQIVEPLIKLLGLDVGGADTSGLGMHCTAPKLVK